MIQDSFSRLFLALSVLLVLPFAQAQAQVEQSVPVPAEAAPQAAEQQSLPPEPDMDVTILRDDFAGKYNPSSLENLAKLYWRLGAFDIEDAEAIGNYLKINECSLYAEYINDDLEWRQIIASMGEHLSKTRNTFPLSFQFVLPLHLGRYDPALGGFPLVDKTGFKDAKRIEVDSIDRDKEICHSRSAVRDYPQSLMLILHEPYTFDFVKLDEHVAQAYILRKKSEYSALPEAVRVKQYEREAYLRLRVTFSQYNGNMRGEQGRLMAILHGRIDGYEIFEDFTQKRLMLSVDTKAANAAPTSVMSVSVSPSSPSAAADDATAEPEAEIPASDLETEDDVTP